MYKPRSCADGRAPARDKPDAGSHAAAIAPAVVAAAALLVLAASAAAQPAEEPPALDIHADWGFVDREGSRFRGLHITEGDLTIEAAEAIATGLEPETSEWLLEGNVRLRTDLGVIQSDVARGDLDFADNEWHFSGNVRILVGTALLEADEARFAFEARVLAAGELTGAPAVFEDRAPQRNDVVRGAANRIHYDAAAQTLRLSENVVLRVGQSEYRGCEFVYDFGRESVTGGSPEECGERLFIRIPLHGVDTPPTAP